MTSDWPDGGKKTPLADFIPQSGHRDFFQSAVRSFRVDFAGLDVYLNAEIFMRDRYRISVRHWLSVALFLAYWLVAFIVCALQISKGSGEDSGFILQILVPVVAGALTAFSGGRKAVGSLLGVIFGVLDFNLLVAINHRHLPPSAVSQSALGVLLMSIPVFGSISGALGFVGTLLGRLLRRDRVIDLRLETHN